MPYYASTQSIYRNLRPRLKDSLALVKSLESLAEDLEASADNLYDEILEEDHRD
jgi:glucose-6-phosphate-specific signal transduction histidine kinase